MNPLDILKSKLKSLKLEVKVADKNKIETRRVTKEELESDAKKVRDTFSNEDLQPRIITA